MPISFDSVAAKDPSQKEWREKCHQYEVPYVSIETKGKMCSINWSMMTLPARQFAIVQEQQLELMGGIMGLSRRYQNPKSSSIITADGGVLYEIGSNKADALAKEIFEFLLSSVAIARPQVH